MECGASNFSLFSNLYLCIFPSSTLKCERFRYFHKLINCRTVILLMECAEYFVFILAHKLLTDSNYSGRNALFCMMFKHFCSRPVSSFLFSEWNEMSIYSELRNHCVCYCHILTFWCALGVIDLRFDYDLI